MNDQERLSVVLNKLRGISGLDEETFGRLTAELDRDAGESGYEASGRLKVVVFDAKSYDVESFDRCNRGRFALHYVQAALDADTAAAASGYKVVCIFVNDTCDADVVQVLAERGVELIALRCSGFNNVDLMACKQRKISVVRVPAYSPHAVAEHTAGLMLMLNRRLHLAYLRNRAGSFVLEGLTGFDMHGKTAGVIGTGRIGQCVVDILRGFGCHVLALDKYVNEEVAAKPRVQYCELPRLLRESDVITLHVPLFPETYHLIGRDAIGQMKQGVMLINTSRGGLVDTRALIDGLKSGRIGSAGLDVYEEEAGIFFHDHSDKVLTDDVLARLLTFNNVVITSHQAFLTREALTNIADTTLANIEEYAHGKRDATLTNAVRAE